MLKNNKDNQQILITGAGGMLGQAVYDAFSHTYKNCIATDIDLNETWLSHLDVRDMAECEKVFKNIKPTIVLHLAALTDLEYCERNSDDAWSTNALGTENIAILTKRYGTLMVYISTAGVFDGKKNEYTDFDSPNPLNYYGKSKYYGENFIQSYLDRFFIFRAGWMMGGGPKKDKKFINKIFKQIQDGKKDIYVVDDKLGTPTYTHDFAKGILNLIQTDYYGVYNQVCSGGCSRLDVAKEFLKNLNLDKKIKVHKVSSNYFKKEYFAPRPVSEQLINLKLTKRNLNIMRPWQKCLKEYSEIFKIGLNLL